jgi:hypothetical protein
MMTLFLAAPSWAQEFVATLRKHGTILSGLVRVLPERLSSGPWAAIARNVVKAAKTLMPVPKSITDIMSGIAPALMLESVAASLNELLSNVKRGKGGDTKEPLRIVVDAMVKELGGVESLGYG